MRRKGLIMNNKLFSKDEEKRIAEIYSSACSDITAPQELYGKVTDGIAETKRRIRVNWKVAAAIAAFFIIILGSNVLVYATTGTGWIGKIVVAMDTSSEQTMKFEEIPDAFGRTYYFGTVQDEVTGKSFSVGTYDPTILLGKSFRIEGDRIIVTDEEGNSHTVSWDEEGYSAVLAIPTYLPEDPRSNK